MWGRGEGGRHSSGVRAAAASRLYLDSADAAEEGIHPGEGQGRREFPGHWLLVFLGEEEGRRDRPWASQVFTGSNAGTDRRQPRPAPARPRAHSRPHLEEELHVRTAEVVGPVQLPQDVHGQRDVVQHLLDLALQTLQHLLGAQVGPRLGQTEDVPKSGRASWAGPRAPSAGGRAGWGPAAVARRVPLGFTPQPVCRALRGFQETELLPSPGPSAPAQAAQACRCGTRRPRKPRPSLACWDSPPSNTGLGGLALPRSWENSG